LSVFVGLFIIEKREELEKNLSGSPMSPFLFSIQPCPATGSVRFFCKSGLKLFEYHTLKKEVEKAVIYAKKEGRKNILSLRCKHARNLKCKAKVQLEVDVADVKISQFWDPCNFNVRSAKGNVLFNRFTSNEVAKAL